MSYTDQLVATGLLNDVGNPVRVNVEESYRQGLELEGGVQVDADVAFGRQRHVV